MSRRVLWLPRRVPHQEMRLPTHLQHVPPPQLIEQALQAPPTRLEWEPQAPGVTSPLQLRRGEACHCVQPPWP